MPEDADPDAPDGVITKLSKRSVDETVTRLTDLLDARGVKVFAVIDHSGEAGGAGLDLRETKLVIFGNPAAGTAVMVAAPLSALDLPLKVLVWADGTQTKVSYLAPRALAERHRLDAELGQRLAVIDALTDAVTAD